MTPSKHRVEHSSTVRAAALAVDSVLDLVHDAAAQAARLFDPNDPARLSPEILTTLSLCSDDLRVAIEEIISSPRAHLKRKLAIVLDGISAQLDSFVE